MVEFPQVYYKDIQMDIVYFETGGDDVLPHISKPAKAMFYDSNLGMVCFLIYCVLLEMLAGSHLKILL